MQDKTSTLEWVASSEGLSINKEKTKVIRINAKNIQDKDIKVRIGKARTAFHMLIKYGMPVEISNSPRSGFSTPT